MYRDEDPVKECPYGPYLQSKRLEIYHENAQKLIESGHAYHCFCSEEVIFVDPKVLALHFFLAKMKYSNFWISLVFQNLRKTLKFPFSEVGSFAEKCHTDETNSQI